MIRGILHCVKFDGMTAEPVLPDDGKYLLFENYKSVPDPELEIREGGQSSRPVYKRGDQSPKNFFWPFGPQFALKTRGALPWIRHCKSSVMPESHGRMYYHYMGYIGVYHC